MKCPDCGWELSDKAHFCPKCNHQFSPAGTPTWKVFLMVGAVVFLVLVVIPIIPGKESQEAGSHPVGIPTPTPALPSGGEAIPLISSQDLFQAYRSNEVTADLRFKGKAIVLSDARIDAISKDMFGKPYLVLRSGNPGERFNVTFDPRFEHQLLTLQAGQKVILCGRVTGLLMGSVMIRDGQVLQGI